MSVIRGFPNSLQQGEGGQLVTAQPVHGRTALDQLASTAVQPIGSDVVDSISTDHTALPVITAAAHGLDVGQQIIFTSGNLDKREFQIVAVTTNTITLGVIPTVQGVVTFPVATDTFDTFRHARLEVDSTGTLKVLTASGSAVDDGSAVDTNTQGNLVFGATAIPGLAKALMVDGSQNLKVATPSTTNGGATAKTADYDTGAGTDTVTMQGIALPASGGAVAGGTATNPVRVDVTGTTAQPITDNGGSITVDGTVTVQDSGGSISVDDNGGTLSIDDGGGSITVDGNVAVSGTVTVDSELPAAAALADAATPANTPTVGAVPVLFNGTNFDRARSVINGINSTGTGIQSVGMVGQFDDVSPGTITENQFGPVRMSVRREQYTQIRDAAGNERGLNVDASGNISVAAVTTSITPGTAAANLGKAEDAVHTSGDVGVMGLCVGNDALATFAADGDYIPRAVDVKGRGYVTGQVAHDAANAGNPVAVGAEARSSDLTAVSNADMVKLIADLLGRQVVLPYALPDSALTGFIQNISTATNTTLIAAQGAGVRIYITSLLFSNESVTGNTVSLQDGAGGTTLFQIRLVGSTTSAPIAVTFPYPLRLTANTLANINTGFASSVYVSAVGFKAAN